MLAGELRPSLVVEAGRQAQPDRVQLAQLAQFAEPPVQRRLHAHDPSNPHSLSWFSPSIGRISSRSRSSASRYQRRP